jgi:hypothetical protein
MLSSAMEIIVLPRHAAAPQWMLLHQVVAQHDASVRNLFFVKEMGNGMLLTGSWDKTLRYWDLR